MAGPRHALTLRSTCQIQRSRSRAYEMRFRRGTTRHPTAPLDCAIQWSSCGVASRQQGVVAGARHAVGGRHVHGESGVSRRPPPGVRLPAAAAAATATGSSRHGGGGRARGASVDDGCGGGRGLGVGRLRRRRRARLPFHGGVCRRAAPREEPSTSLGRAQTHARQPPQQRRRTTGRLSLPPTC